AAVASGDLDGTASFLVTGPLMPPAQRAELAASAAGLPGLTLVPFTADLPSYLNAADLVVCRAGYNTLCETVALGKRVVAVPLSRGEQYIRAERFARRGLVRLVPQDGLTPQRLAEAVRQSLGAPPPSVSIDFDGLRRISD